MKVTKLLMITLLIAGVSSCGKDNEKKSTVATATAPVTSNPVTSNVGEGACATAQNLDQLKAIFNNWSVGNYTLPNQKYAYEEYTMNEFELKEKEAWIFEYTSLDFKGSFKRKTTKDSNTAESEFGTSKTEIRNNIVAILNRVSPFSLRSYSTSLHEVVDTNGDVYGINLCAPMAANPVTIFDESSNTIVKLGTIQGQ